MYKILKADFQDISQFSTKDVAYQSGDPRYRSFYEYEPVEDEFERLIQSRSRYSTDRALLTTSLKEDYQSLDLPKVDRNIELLNYSTTFTVTTAHQPVLLLGPLYYIYKICSTIHLSNRLKEEFPKYNFVPVFVMGAEDHDFDEISSVHFFGKTFTWYTDQTGSVGRMNCDGLEEVLTKVKDTFGNMPHADHLKDIISSSLEGAGSYAHFNFLLINKLFGSFGLVVINMSNARFKKAFLPYALKEVTEGISARTVRKTQDKLNALGIKEQAYVRDINLFYITDNQRHRIISEGEYYAIGDQTYDLNELLNLLRNNTDRISPNVVMRPIFQELILPNLAYIGGGGELAYWLERKEQFEAFDLPFPMLIRRNSAMIVSNGIVKKCDSLSIDVLNLINDQEKTTKEYVLKNQTVDITLESEILELDQYFMRLAQKAKVVDAGLEKYILARGNDQIKEIKKISSKLNKAAKRSHEVNINKINTLYSKLYPNNKLQERYESFIPYFLKYGQDWIEYMVAHLDPLVKKYLVLKEGV